MSTRILQSRLLFYLSKNNRPFSSSVSANPPKEPIISSSSSRLNHEPSLSSTSPPPPNEPQKEPWGFFKFGVFGALTGVAATAGYATYAYTLEEVDMKTKPFRDSANYTLRDDASALEKLQGMFYSVAMTVPTKSIELYLDLRKSIEEHIRAFTEPSSEMLLPDLHPLEKNVCTLVLDLNETLVYSEWNRERGWKTFKRPGVDTFLEHLAQFYEIIVYSDQPSMYVVPVTERLDKKGYIRFRLSRSETKYMDGKHYRDLSKLNRNPGKVLYVSGHALESSLQPENCVQIKPWKLETDDRALLDLIPFLEYLARTAPAADVRQILASFEGRDIANEFNQRSREFQRRMQEQQQRARLWQR